MLKQYTVQCVNVLCTVAFYTVLKSTIFEMEWLDNKSIIRSFLSSGSQDRIVRKCFSNHILHLLHIFVEVNEQMKKLRFVITSFQDLL